MRRTRKDATKVWHNPELTTFPRQGSVNSRSPAVDAEARREAKHHRAALEALFKPTPARDRDGDEEASKSVPINKTPGRIVLAPPSQSDPRAVERQKLLNKLLTAEGRPNVSKAADEIIKAGFTFPVEQDVYLQLLEHASEDHVRSAIDVLDGILAGELPRRRAMLESRLRRIEQFAEEPTTREAAERLRRRVSGRCDGKTAPSSAE
jgi:hypothetical protein